MSDDRQAAPATPAPVDAKTFWRTLGSRATGLTVVTTDSDEGPAGFLGLSATHLTADPPTILVSIDKKTSALAGVLSRRHFAVNYLPVGAKAIAEAFGGKAVTGAARFALGSWGVLVTGAPVLMDALGVFDCVVEDVIERGDIWIIIGTAAAAAVNDGEPLIYFRGKTYEGLPLT